jgi:hypothetical protein
MRLGKTAGVRTRYRTWRRDRHGGAPGCEQFQFKVACGAPDVRAGFGTARISPACGEGFNGPLTAAQGGRLATDRAWSEKMASSGRRTSTFSHSLFMAA